MIENHLIVCAPHANALFRLLIFPQGATFIRGDLNDDGRATISDAVYIAEYLFRKGASPGCLDAGDTNDDGVINLADPVQLLNYLFLNGAPPASPGPEACGPDPRPDSLARCVSNCP